MEGWVFLAVLTLRCKMNGGWSVKLLGSVTDVLSRVRARQLPEWRAHAVVALSLIVGPKSWEVRSSAGRSARRQQGIARLLRTATLRPCQPQKRLVQISWVVLFFSVRGYRPTLSRRRGIGQVTEGGCEDGGVSLHLSQGRKGCNRCAFRSKLERMGGRITCR